jgi:hypothetical protein
MRMPSSEVANQCQPGRNPDTHLQRRASIPGDLRNRLDKAEGGANRALSVMAAGG